MIDENKLIKRLKRAKEKLKPNMSFRANNVKQLFDEIINLIEEQPKIGNWIIVKEQPDDYEVICCNSHDDIIIGHIIKDNRSVTGYSAINDNEIMYDVVAWMRKPMPYGQKMTNNQKCPYVTPSSIPRCIHLNRDCMTCDVLMQCKNKIPG